MATDLDVARNLPAVQFGRYVDDAGVVRYCARRCSSSRSAAAFVTQAALEQVLHTFAFRTHDRAPGPGRRRPVRSWPAR